MTKETLEIDDSSILAFSGLMSDFFVPIIIFISII